MEKFNDPLDALINKHKAANGEAVETETKKEVPEVKELLPTDELPTEIPASVNTPKVDDVNYGDDDNAEEIAAEEAKDQEERQASIEAMMAERSKQINTMMPPEAHDPVSTSADMNYQTDKLAVVTTMVNKVAAKYHLFNGGIPDAPDPKRGYFGKRAVMGDLIEYYDTHTNNEITPEFEAIILNNWVMEDGSIAAEWIKQPHDEKPAEESEQAEVKNIEKKKADQEEFQKIIVKVPESSDVTVNIDETVVHEMTNKKSIDVVVKKVSEEELKYVNVVENSQQKGIIQTYDTGINDTPITLPASAYRCVMRPINWFDFIRLVAPSSQNRSDDELKKWSVIYKHMKNVSIGEFKDFDDFLKKTKYQDRELLMWAILVATADEEEVLNFTCRNPKCQCKFDMKYRPREILHLDPEHIPAYYDELHNTSVMEDAVALFNKVSYKKTRYELPHTKIIVEINEPTAYEFITNKLKLVQDLYTRFVPDGDMSRLNPEDPVMAEFDYLSANALYISAMIIRKDNKEYRFTNWEDIEDIIKLSLDTDDSAILLKVIQKSRANVSPVDFYLEHVTCPKCHREEPKIPINDIGNTLLFQVSQRLDNIEVNLKEMD